MSDHPLPSIAELAGATKQDVYIRLGEHGDLHRVGATMAATAVDRRRALARLLVEVAKELWQGVPIEDRADTTGFAFGGPDPLFNFDPPQLGGLR